MKHTKNTMPQILLIHRVKYGDNMTYLEVLPQMGRYKEEKLIKYIS